MISKSLTSDEIIFIHEVIEENFQLPRGHVKVGELETLVEKSKSIPFSGKKFDMFTQASILMEGITRLHIFTDGNKRTALETTRQYFNRNDRVFVIPLSGTNFMYKIARDKERNTDEVVQEIADWLKSYSPRVQEWYKINGIIMLHLQIPIALVRFFSKLRLARISRWILRKYLAENDPEIQEFMLSIYEKQLGLFQLSKDLHDKQQAKN